MYNLETMSLRYPNTSLNSPEIKNPFNVDDAGWLLYLLSDSLDTIAPDVNVTVPTQNQVLKTNNLSVISGTASDDVSVNRVYIKISRLRNGVRTYWNGTSFGSPATSLPVTLADVRSNNTTWSYPVKPALKSALDFGVYLVTANAVDTAGNISAPVSRNFSLDGQAPAVTITSPTQNQSLLILSFSPSLVNGNTTDDINVASVRLTLSRVREGVTQYWNGTAFATNQVWIPATVRNTSAPNTTWSWQSRVPTPAALDTGAYKLSVYATDAVGQNSSTIQRDFNLTASMPQPTGQLVYQASPTGAELQEKLWYYNFTTKKDPVDMNATFGWGLTYITNAQFSPNGSQLVFAARPASQSTPPRGTQDVYLWNMDGRSPLKNLTRLTAPDVGDEDPKFSPDGTTIVYKTIYDGNYQLALMDTNGNLEKRYDIGSTDAEKIIQRSGPFFSRDGRYLMFWENVGAQAELYRCNASDGKGRTVVAANSGKQDYYPVA